MHALTAPAIIIDRSCFISDALLLYALNFYLHRELAVGTCAGSHTEAFDLRNIRRLGETYVSAIYPRLRAVGSGKALEFI